MNRSILITMYWISNVLNLKILELSCSHLLDRLDKEFLPLFFYIAYLVTEYSVLALSWCATWFYFCSQSISSRMMFLLVSFLQAHRSLLSSQNVFARLPFGLPKRARIARMPCLLRLRFCTPGYCCMGRQVPNAPKRSKRKSSFSIVFRHTIFVAQDKMSNTTSNKYAQDGPEAKEIAQYLPYFPFKGIPRFYDIGGFLYEPKVFQQIVDIFAERYQALEVDVICGLDARGFILGPPIALALKKPFVMMRKAGKMPNTITSDDYKTEYGQRAGLTVQKDKIQEGHRVLIIDDLVATGGTLSSAISLVKMLKGTVVECACVVELKMFIDPPEASGLPSRTKLFKDLGHGDIPVWGLISEDVLTNEAKLPDGYVDDGEEH